MSLRFTFRERGLDKGLRFRDGGFRVEGVYDAVLGFQAVLFRV